MKPVTACLPDRASLILDLFWFYDHLGLLNLVYYHTFPVRLIGFCLGNNAVLDRKTE